MGPDWKSCPQCGLMVPPADDGAVATVCSGCGEALQDVAADAHEPEWYYAEDKKKKGPVSLAQLTNLVAGGVIGPATLVRRTDAKKWRRVIDVAELRPSTPTAPPKIENAGTFFARHRRVPYELYAALAAVLVITLMYLIFAHNGAPRPSGFVGHSLGIVGFALMLCAETFYSLRKRSKAFRRGRTSVWLQVHIFIGIVGPYLVLLHSAGRFQGLAGFVTLLVMLVVLSGFVGRYIYTAVPRTHDGAELAVRELEQELNEDAEELKELGLNRLNPQTLAAVTARPPKGWRILFGRFWLAHRQRGVIRQALRSMRKSNPRQADRVENVLLDRYRLLIMVHSLPETRRLMAVWHMVHVPLGVVMFTLAFLHVAGALYYSTLLR